MNTGQRAVKQALNKPQPFIFVNGRPCLLAEAGNLANQELRLGHLQAAVDIYNLILAKFPDCAEAYDNRGVALNRMGRHAEALASAEQALSFKPRNANTHNNRGLALQAMKRHAEALASYDKALALRPDLVEVHNNRGLMLLEMERFAEALANFNQTIAIQPGNAKTHINRGVALQKMKRNAEALTAFDNALALQPDLVECHYNRGLTLMEMKRYTEAVACFDRAIMLMPSWASAHANRGKVLDLLMLYDEALASFDRALALNPDHAETFQLRGLLLIYKGDMREAERMFLKALVLKPDFPAPLCCLASLQKFQSIDKPLVKQIQTLLDKPGIPSDDRELLNFALGKIYDDCDCYDEAFERYRLANQSRNARVSYDRENVQRTTDGLMEVFSRDFFAQNLAFRSESRAPLFIVGMPRSGTTLMASIFSNHPSIATAGELPTIADLATNLAGLTKNGATFPHAAKQISPVVAAGLIRAYEQRLRRDVGGEVPYVIDKHPLNFSRLGFIAMLFPKALIIHCTRHPMETGLSNYFQRFDLSYDYSFDLGNIGHFYCEYARLMAHWRDVLPVKMIEISYEDMILNTEAVVRQTLDELGLEWDERCLAPHTNSCAVDTASRWQVRQPIYTRSLQRWRHYEKHLAPLKEMLLLNGHIVD